MVNEGYAPGRGEVIRIDFNPQKGHEHAGHLPAVVLSPVDYNRKVGLVLLCPVTSKRKGYPFEVEIPDGLPVSGVALSDQMKSLDWRACRAEFACTLPSEVMEKILQRARLMLA
jgi:mRNA interferase MazF